MKLDKYFWKAYIKVIGGVSIFLGLLLFLIYLATINVKCFAAACIVGFLLLLASVANDVANDRRP